MNEIEKRELFEQQQKIFEARAQRMAKRSGSFNFLTWASFIAPLIACEEFLAATFKSAAAEEQGAKAAQADASPQAASDDPAASDSSKTGGADDNTATSEASAVQLDPTVLLAQPHDDALKPSAARSEAGAAEGSGGGTDAAESRHHNAHISIEDSSVNPLSVDSHLGSTQMQSGSTLETVQSNMLGGSFGPCMIQSANLPGTVGSLSNDIMGSTIAPVETAAQPVLATVTDTVGTLTHDVGNTVAPVETATQPVLTTVTDTVGTLTYDVGDAIAPVETAAQPVLTTVTDTVGTLTNDVGDTVAPVETAVQPVLATVTDTVGTLTNEVGDTFAPVEAAAQPVLATVTDTVGTLTSDVSHPADTGNAASDALADVAPVNDTIATSGDVIALNDAPPSSENALYTGTEYTDYGVNLSSDIAVPPQDTGSSADGAAGPDTAPPPPEIVDANHRTDHPEHAIL